MGARVKPDMPFNKRILSNGRTSPRLGRPNPVTYDRGIGFTSSAQAERELVTILKEREADGSITDSEKKLLDALKKWLLT